MPPRKERPRRTRITRAEHSLAVLVQSLEQRKLVIELRNDMIVRGTLDAADEFLNLTMSSVTVQTLQGGSNTYEFLYVKGRNIRFVHLPKSLDPAQAIEAQRKKIIEARLEEFKERQKNLLPRLAKGQLHSVAAAEDDYSGDEDEDGGDQDGTAFGHAGDGGVQGAQQHDVQQQYDQQYGHQQQYDQQYSDQQYSQPQQQQDAGPVWGQAAVSQGAAAHGTQHAGLGGGAGDGADEAVLNDDDEDQLFAFEKMLDDYEQEGAAFG